MKSKLAFVILLILSVLLIICGFTGSMGRLLACLLVPSEVEENTGN